MEEHEIIRFTLNSYIGSLLKEINISKRQKEAISKMLFLSEPQFNELIADIITEIQLRSTKTASNSKLSKLNEDKFKNLVIDVFLVYNHKYPSENLQNNTEIESLINDLEALISKLKENEEERVMNKILNERTIQGRVDVYSNYLISIFGKYNENTKVILAMKELLTFDKKVKLFEFEEFFQVGDKMVNETNEEYFYYKNKFNESYGNIRKKYFINIVELLYDIHENNEKNDEFFNKEVNGIIEILNRIKENEYNGLQVAENVKNIIERFKNKFNDDNIELNNVLSEIDTFIKKGEGNLVDIVFKSAYSIKNILINMPKDVSNNSLKKINNIET